jgi:rubrerythrin
MGGRGRPSPINTRQQTLNDYLHKEKVKEIIKKSSEARLINNEINQKNEQTSQLTLYKKCACCNNLIIPVNTEFEVCPICGWIDDPFQNANPDNPNGKNGISLIEAKKILHGTIQID